MICLCVSAFDVISQPFQNRVWRVANEYDLQTLNLYQNDTSLPIKKGLLKVSLNFVFERSVYT